MRMRAFNLMSIVGALALLLASTAQAGGTAPTNGLLGYWKLDESSGDIAADSGPAGNVYPGTLLGEPLPTWSSEGMFDNCVRLDHNGTVTNVCRVDLDPAQGALTHVIDGNEYTLATWVKPYAVPPAGGLQCYPIIAMCLSTTVADFLGYGVDQKFVMGHTYKQTPGDEQHYLVRATATAVSPTGIWYHVAGVVSRGSPSTVKLYVNGVPVRTNTYANYPSTTIWSWDPMLFWRFGAFSYNSGKRDPNGGSRVFIDEARIYNRALSDAEVYNCFTEGQNFAPTVSITNPLNGAVFTAPTDISIEALASDDGMVTNVAFYEGANWLGEADAAPYGFVWTNPPVGTYGLTAVATDDQGVMGTSAVVNVFVNDAANQLPTVSIESPTEGASYTAPAEVTIVAAASDSDGTVAKVEFYEGANKLGEDAAEPYSFVWTNVPGGAYSLTARAFDNDGAFSNSVAVGISVNARPTVSITKPLGDARFPAPGTVVIRVTASDSDGTVAKVAFYEGLNLLGEDASAPYEYVWTDVSVGDFLLTAVATDNKNATGTSAGVAIKVVPPMGNGPGGVGSTDGASDLRQWLRADAGCVSTNAGGEYASTNGGKVAYWLDWSGWTNNHARANLLWQTNDLNQPAYVTDAANGMPMVEFTSFGDGSVNQYFDSRKFMDFSEWTVMYVGQRTVNPNRPCYLLSTGGGNTADPSICILWAGADPGYIGIYVRDKNGTGMGGAGFSSFPVDRHVCTVRLRFPNDTQASLDTRFNGATTTYGPATFATDTIYSTNPLASYVGAESIQNFGYYNLSGYLGELIVFSRALSAAEYTIIESALAAKYGIALSGGDHYTGDDADKGDCDYDVIGIGQESDGGNLYAHAAGLTIEPVGGTMDNGEYLMAGHNGGENGLTLDHVSTMSFLERWQRAWYLDVTGTLDVEITFDWGESGIAVDWGEVTRRVLFYRPSLDSDFEVVRSEPRVEGTKTSFTLTNAQNGFYTLGVSTQTGSMIVIR